MEIYNTAYKILTKTEWGHYQSSFIANILVVCLIDKYPKAMIVPIEHTGLWA